MKYYLKQSVFLIAYNLFMSITALAISAIPDHLRWLQMVLFALNAGLFLLIVGMTMFKEGETALKVRNANDLEREQIIKTGNALPLKLHEEYKPWKGFFIGFLIGSPIVICLIIHSILISFNTALVGAGAVSGFVYLAFFAPVSVLSTGVIELCYQYYILLYAIPVISAVCGLCYLRGAGKIQRQYDRIKEKQRQIYGE